MQIKIPELYEEKKRRLEQIIFYYENNRMGYINVQYLLMIAFNDCF